MNNRLIIVADDAGYSAVDRGIREFAEQTEVPVCADYMMTHWEAPDNLRAMERVTNVSRGLHFELLGFPDDKRYQIDKRLRAGGSCLGERPAIQTSAKRWATQQLDQFRQIAQQEPAHISTHGDFNIGPDGEVMDWWIEHMIEIFDGDVPSMQHENPVLRHNKYSWNLVETARSPLEPEEFKAEAGSHPVSPVVEFVLHPARHAYGDAALNMLFDETMRARDLESAITIVKSEVIEQAGRKIVSVENLREDSFSRVDSAHRGGSMYTQHVPASSSAQVQRSGEL